MTDNCHAAAIAITKRPYGLSFDSRCDHASHVLALLHGDRSDTRQRFFALMSVTGEITDDENFWMPSERHIRLDWDPAGAVDTRTDALGDGATERGCLHARGPYHRAAGNPFDAFTPLEG